MLKKSIASVVHTTKEELTYRYVTNALYKGKRFVSEALFPKLMFRTDDSERRAILIDLLTWVDNLPSTKFIGFKSVFADHSASADDDCETLRRLGRRIRVFTFEGHLYWIIPLSGVENYLKHYDHDDGIDYKRLAGSEYDNAPMVLYTTFRHNPFSSVKKVLVDIDKERKARAQEAIVKAPNKGGLKMTIGRMNDKGEWESAKTYTRDFKTVVMSEDTEKKVLYNTLRWVKKKTRYLELGIPHFRTMILVGPPGMGKTSIIRALATELQYSLYIGDINDDTTKDSLEHMFVKAGPRSIVAFDDFDTISAFRDRKDDEARLLTQAFSIRPWRSSMSGSIDTLVDEAKRANLEARMNKPEDTRKAYRGGGGVSPLKLRDVLQAFDGITVREEQIVILCTNTLEGIDKAFLRKGRVDEIVHVGLFTDREVRKYITVPFPEYDLSKIPEGTVFADISGADLQYLFEQNDEDADAFVASIPTVPQQETKTNISVNTANVVGAE